MSITVPRFVVIKSKYYNKYLKRISEKESKEKSVSDTFLNFLGDDITSRYIKFELEEAKKDGELVHIKCCHNNKYLSLQNYSGTYYIEATAEKPSEEDGPTSTMFKPIKYYQDLKFVHESTGLYACRSNVADPDHKKDGLCAMPTPIDESRDLFEILDWESLVLFPKTTVALKLPGKDNKYLSVQLTSQQPHTEYKPQYLKFVPNEDNGNKTIANEISSFGDGYVRIKNISTGKFWTVDVATGWVTADSSDTTGKDTRTLFWPVKLSENTIALRDWKRYRFCQSLTSDGITDCLNAQSFTITNEVYLEVVENIISKSIYSVRYHESESKIYNLEVVQKGYASADNYEKEENNVSLKFSYKKTSSSNFGSSHSLKLGGKITFTVDWIPFIVQSGIEFGADYTYVHHWGETTATETLIDATYTAKVVGGKRVKVTLVAAQGMCDVPFSYTRRDILYNGEVLVHKMDDGIFTGVNTFNFDFRSEYEDLPPQTIDISLDQLKLDQSSN